MLICSGEKEVDLEFKRGSIVCGFFLIYFKVYIFICR